MAEIVLEAIVENNTDQVLAALDPTQWENYLQDWLGELTEDLPEAIAYEVGVRFTNDAEMQQLNAQYRQKDQPTDVLAFAALEVDTPDAGEFAETEPLYLGDIVISVDTALRQAQEQQHELKVELGWLMSHGLLHLLGWDHPDEAQLIAMLDCQRRLLINVGLI